jgi:hypothetical protein
MLISGETEDQVSGALRATAQLLRSREDNLLFVLDGDDSFNETLEGGPNLSKFHGMNGLCHGVNGLFHELQQRETDLIALEDQEDFEAMDAYIDQCPQICILINRMHLVMEQLSEDARNRLIGICESSGNLGAIVIGAGKAKDIGDYLCIEALTGLMVNCPDVSDASSSGANYQKGLCIGGKLRNHDGFQQLNDIQKAMLLENGDAAVMDCGTVTRIKVIG